MLAGSLYRAFSFVEARTQYPPPENSRFGVDRNPHIVGSVEGVACPVATQRAAFGGRGLAVEPGHAAIDCVDRQALRGADVGSARYDDAVEPVACVRVSAVDEVNKRSELWDSLIIVGNGARIRGKRAAPFSNCIY